MFLVIMPVIVPFFQQTGMGMKGVYILQSVFAVTTFICEIPSGYISDLLGRKKTLMLACVLKGIGFSLFPLANDINLFIVAEVILGIAVSLNSGTDTAMIYDSMEAAGSQKAQIKVLGRMVSIFTLGEGLAALMASFIMIYSVSLNLLAVVSAYMSWIPLFFVLGMHEPPRSKMQQSHHENFKYIFHQLFKQTLLLRLIIVNSIFSFLGTLIAVWAFQKYWENLQIPVLYFGYLWALSNFTASMTSRKAHKLEKSWGSTMTLIVVGILPIIGYLGMGLIESFVGVLFCFLFQATRGIAQVVLKDALNKRVTADFRATANSIVSMGVRVMFVGVGPCYGYLMDQYGLKLSNLVMAGVYVTVFLFLLIPLLNQRSHFIAINKE